MSEVQHILAQTGAEDNLSNLAQDLADKYVEYLEKARANATYALSNAAMNYYFRWKGDVLMLTFRLPEEWYYVEHGRSPNNGRSGKRWEDPVGDILLWIENKHLVPRSPMRSARVPESKKELPPDEKKLRMARGIVHKIMTRGFYTKGPSDKGPVGKNVLEGAIDAVKLKDNLEGILKDAIGRDIRVQFADIVTTMKK